jgi:hypothetical protein
MKFFPKYPPVFGIFCANKYWEANKFLTTNKAKLLQIIFFADFSIEYGHFFVLSLAVNSK